MDIILVVGLCLLSAILCKTLENDERQIAFIISIFVVCYVLLICVLNLSDIFDMIKDMFDSANINEEYFKVLIKAIGISYVTQIGCDLSKDCGESAMSTEISLFGKLSILYISLPIYSAVIKLITELIT